MTGIVRVVGDPETAFEVVLPEVMEMGVNPEIVHEGLVDGILVVTGAQVGIQVHVTEVHRAGGAQANGATAATDLVVGELYVRVPHAGACDRQLADRTAHRTDDPHA